ncbi:MAG: efflux RND transporter permease subunit [Steroidobacteraceae bacterium]|nr:efflux RND transporter permease subunit [Steroidobacteraceae bacterium]
MSRPLGFSGRVARFFLENQLTPLLALTALLMGIFALAVTPREEDPQIDVTFANIFIPFPGASARQVENLVATPMEKVLGEISGVKHIYSVSRPGLAVLTVQYQVGIHRNDAIVRLYNAVYSNEDWRPPGTGILQPLIKPKSIDDVPILTLTLWSKDPRLGGDVLGKVARSMISDIKRVPNTRDVYTVGDTKPSVHVELDPARLAAAGLTAADIAASLQAANLVRQAGHVISGGLSVPVQAGAFLASRADIGGLIVSARDGKPIYLDDVATVTEAPQTPSQYAWFGTGPAGVKSGLPRIAQTPAVTIAIAKKPGSNAIDVATAVIRRIDQLKGIMIPKGVEVTVTRNYGVTADQKARKLMEKLVFATTSVVLLVLLTMGRREAVVVGAAVMVTLAATLFASWAWGFTINRVSLFALIFSIGILVDDAIVIVENVHRHRSFDKAPLSEVIPRAVDEVGGPTILATFTVIAALLPMAFVSGLMGPYMSPIPINASMGMMISLAIALAFTPWMCRKLLAGGGHGAGHDAGTPSAADAPAARDTDEIAPETRVHRLFARLMNPFLNVEHAQRNRHRLYLGTLGAIVIAVLLVVVQLVVLKMLPFDNKSEFQVIVNMPDGTPVENTARVLSALSGIIRRVPEVTNYQAYAGTAAPIDFNGLVRQYYLRQQGNLGDLQVNLVDKSERSRKSHDIAMAVRPALAALGKRLGAASIQVVEVPPGPPVQAPIVAEIFGPNYPAQERVGRALRKLFDTTPGIVDTDDSLPSGPPRYEIELDRAKAALLGVPQAEVTNALVTALSGYDATYIHSGAERDPIAVRLELRPADKDGLGQALQMPVRTSDGKLLPLSEVVKVVKRPWEATIYHKDLLPVVFVTGDMAGRTDSPLYGMFRIVSRVSKTLLDGHHVAQRFISQPNRLSNFSIKWSGEWQITYETFRDMGIAYAVGLIFIYLLLVAQFGSYLVPLIVMAPIPLTIIGVMPGHALLGAQFTATSMIGMIALAGIIVRNSILLVDFINREVESGQPPAQAVIRAAAIRARPIVLTGLAAMIGAFFIVDDPIFQGLAISLIFGILVSTMLTLMIIPLLYYGYLVRRRARTVH